MDITDVSKKYENACPVQLLEMVDNSPRLCTCLFGWFFAMLLGRQVVSSSKLARLCLVHRFTQPFQGHFLGQWPASPAFKRGPVAAGNRAPCLLSTYDWFSQLPWLASAVDTMALEVYHLPLVPAPRLRTVRREDVPSDSTLATSGGEPEGGELGGLSPTCVVPERLRQ